MCTCPPRACNGDTKRCRMQFSNAKDSAQQRQAGRVLQQQQTEAASSQHQRLNKLLAKQWMAVSHLVSLQVLADVRQVLLAAARVHHDVQLLIIDLGDDCREHTPAGGEAK